MCKSYFIGFKKNSTNNNPEYFVTFCSEFPRKSLAELVPEIFANHDFDYFNSVFNQVNWLNELDETKDMEEIDAMRFKLKFDKGFSLIHLFIVGTIEQLKKDTWKIQEELSNSIILPSDEFVNHPAYCGKADINVLKNLKTINNEEKLCLINHEDFLSNTEWMQGYIFDLDNNILEQYERHGVTIEKIIKERRCQ